METNFDLKIEHDIYCQAFFKLKHAKMNCKDDKCNEAAIN